jgi:regulator of nucleoside diphosphate kinase
MTPRRIYLTRQDYNRLRKLVVSVKNAHREPGPQFTRFVHELAAAVVLDPEELPDDIITMHSRVGYCIGTSQQTNYVRLGFPARTSEHPENISILSPLGLALIGEYQGAEFDYVAPGGTFQIRITSVEHQHIETHAV